MHLRSARKSGSMSDIISVYADGGVIGRNPSAIGGTYAWCHVSTDLRVVDIDVGRHIVDYHSGVVTPERAKSERVTNNHTEYFALARCLCELPKGWSGQVYSDSQITLGRFFSGWKHENVPKFWERRMREIIAELGNVTPILLDGHPTKAQLAAGIGKRGNPCSSFNVWCDKACGEVAKRVMKERS